MGASLIAVLCLGQIPVDPQSNDPSQSDKQDILCMCFSPSEETLIASTSKNQLYSITMSLTEISKVSLPQQLFLLDFFSSVFIIELVCSFFLDIFDCFWYQDNTGLLE